MIPILWLSFVCEWGGGGWVRCVTILRDTVTTSWSADDICFSCIKYILLVRHLGFVCVPLYIARSGLLHGGSGGIEKLVSDYCCRHFYSGPVNEKKKKHGTAYSFNSTTYCSADRYTVCVDQGFLHVSLFYSWL